MTSFLAEGVLYYDDGDNSLQEKVDLYTQKFTKKTGITPAICLIHESDFEEIEADVKIVPTIRILPNYLLVGVKRENKGEKHDPTQREDQP